MSFHWTVGTRPNRKWVSSTPVSSREMTTTPSAKNAVPSTVMTVSCPNRRFDENTRRSAAMRSPAPIAPNSTFTPAA